MGKIPWTTARRDDRGRTLRVSYCGLYATRYDGSKPKRERWCALQRRTERDGWGEIGEPLATRNCAQNACDRRRSEKAIYGY